MNVTLKVTEFPAGTVTGSAPSELVCEKLALVVTEVIVVGPVPVFVQTAGCGALGVPMANDWNVSVLGEMLPPGCVPVPLKPVATGLPAASCVRITEPGSEPRVSGENTTGKEHPCPGANAIGIGPQVPFPEAE